MFTPEVEARFRRIEDAQIVAAELLHRFEQETRERSRHTEAVLDAIVRWLDRSEDRLEQGEARLKESEDRLKRSEDRLEQNEARLERSDTRQDEFEAKLNAVIDILADASRILREHSQKIDRL